MVGHLVTFFVRSRSPLEAHINWINAYQARHSIVSVHRPVKVQGQKDGRRLSSRSMYMCRTWHHHRFIFAIEIYPYGRGWTNVLLYLTRRLNIPKGCQVNVALSNICSHLAVVKRHIFSFVQFWTYFFNRVEIWWDQVFFQAMVPKNRSVMRSYTPVWSSFSFSYKTFGPRWLLEYVSKKASPTATQDAKMICKPLVRNFSCKL